MTEVKKIRIKSGDDLLKLPVGKPFVVENLSFDFVEDKPKKKATTKAKVTSSRA